MQARSLDVFGKWSPAAGTNFLQFLGRIDGPGGFAVVETDDPALLARDTAIFRTFFDMTVYPVLDVQDAARIGGEALESFDPRDQRITLLTRRQNSVEATPQERSQDVVSSEDYVIVVTSLPIQD